MFWKKKKLQWTPRAGVYPSRKLVEKFPELGDLENNPHFRMCVASHNIRAIWNLGVLSAFIMLVNPRPVLLLFVDDASLVAFLDVIIAVAFVLGFLIANEINPLLMDVAKQHVYPEENIRCADYFSLLIKPETIAAALMGLDLRAERLRSLWEITGIGLIGSLASMVFNPTDEVMVSRSLVIYACCFRLGARFWPVGIAARGALVHVKRVKMKIQRTQNPFMYWAKNIIPLLIAGLLVSAGIVLMMIGLDYVFRQHPEMLPRSYGEWMLLNITVASGLLIIGLVYARYCMRLRKYYLNKAEEVVAEILEIKREEIFGLKPKFME